MLYRFVPLFVQKGLLSLRHPAQLSVTDAQLSVSDIELNFSSITGTEQRILVSIKTAYQHLFLLRT